MDTYCAIIDTGWRMYVCIPSNDRVP